MIIFMQIIFLGFIYTSAKYFDQEKSISPGLIREIFNGIDETLGIDGLKTNQKYPVNPDSYGIINVFDAPQNVGDFYGQRIRGWFLAPQTGSYTFYSSCDDVCELYLSNDTDPKNKVLIINQTHDTRYKTFNYFSANKILKASKKYYIEVLMADFSLDDHLSIAVLFENEGQSTLKPIDMNMLSGIRIEKCTTDCVKPTYETCIFENTRFGICTCKYGQKLVNNQVVCQDGIEAVQDCVSVSTEIPLLQNTIVVTLKELGKEYTVSFDVYPKSLFNYWVNVIHLTPGGNNERYGDRNPAVFFKPSTSTLHIASAINNITNSVFNTAPIPLKQWSSIKISQQLVNQCYIYCIYVNGSIVYSVVNKIPVKLSNVKVYASDPWHAAHSGFIRNLVIISKSLAYVSPGLLREVYYNDNSSIDSIDALKENTKYPLAPDTYGIIDMFDTPQNISDFYGQRVRGWFVAPQTGNYTFYSSCDDSCELYISNDSDPKNKRLIINQSSFSSYMEFNNTMGNQSSIMVFLNENYNYYIEAIMSDETGYDHLSIGVVTPYAKGGPLIIISNFLSPIRIEPCVSATSFHEECIFENGAYGICTCKYGQKVNNNQLTCQDSNNQMQSTVFMQAEIPLVRNTCIATLRTLYKEYTVSFEVKPTSFNLNNFNYTNVVHLTTGSDREKYGDRNPGVWFDPNHEGILHVSSAINNSIDSCYDTKIPLPLLHWSSIKIKQELVDGLYKYSIILNETVLYYTTNIYPTDFSNVKVYAADPWYPAQSGSIRNLTIISTPGFSPGLVREVYCNITAESVADNSSKFELNPDFYEVIELFDPPEVSKGLCFQRIHGWFLAHRDGNYTFYSSCNNFCKLYLSNNSEAENKKLIIQQLVKSSFNQLSSEASPIIYLLGNNKYYIESLMLTDSACDYLSVSVAISESLTGSISESNLLKNLLSPLRIEKCISADCTTNPNEKCIPENGVYAICTCINGQKIINNQIVCHDGIETVQDSIFMEEEIPLIRDTYLATLNTLNKEYMVSFDVKPTAFYDNWVNVIQSTGYENKGLNGFRYPDVWFSPFSEGSYGNWSSISSLVSSVLNTKQLLLMQWSSIKVSQVLVDDSYIYSVYLNETLLTSSMNMAPFVLSNITVYAADPWYAAISGSIRNLIITSQAEWSDWSTCNSSSGIGFMNRTRKCSTKRNIELCFGSSTEFARCDKECPELESIFLPHEIILQKNNIVATLSKIYKEYALSFDVMPMSYSSDWHSVIHLTNSSSNIKYGDRNPAVFFHENSNGTMQVCSAVNGNKNYDFFTSSLPLMQWSTLKISQELFNGSYVYSITLNETIVHLVANNQPVEVSNVKVYAGNPWIDPQHGLIKNFVVITGPSGISHQWSAWSSCNVSCGYGWRIRTQDYCLTDYWEKYNMASELIKCFSNDSCEASWSEWSNWSQCNVSSGIGFMNRSRICDSTNTFEWCSGNSSELSACPNNTLGHWSNWSPCSVLCGNGFKSRSWVCNSTQSLELCANKTSEISDCYSNESCNGEWSIWSECSETCGLGYKSSCLRNLLFEGQNEIIRIEKCMNKKCPVDGKWSEWIDNKPCSDSCGYDLIRRKRYCNDPSPSEDGLECWGPSEDYQLCNNSTICPVDGGWTLWSSWAFCNKPCQGGSQLRSRHCTNPAPKYGGLPCNGSDKESIVCHSTECKKVSVNINLFFTDEDYIEQYSNPTKEASMELKSRIKAAIKNLYIKYDKIVNYDLELHSMRDGTG